MALRGVVGFVLFVAIACTAHARPQREDRVVHLHVRFPVETDGGDRAVVDALVRAGVAPEDLARRRGVWVDCLVTRTQLEAAIAHMEREGMSSEHVVLSYDAGRDAAEELKRDAERRRRAAEPRAVDSLDDICAYGVGQMGGYPTVADINSTLWKMHDAFPDVVSRPIKLTPQAMSHEGRLLYAVRMGYATGGPWDPTATATELPNYAHKPRALYTALHHAREPASVTAILYFMCSLLRAHVRGLTSGVTGTVLSLYGVSLEGEEVASGEISVEDAKFVLTERELWFIPVVNPDGYEYNYRTNPDGGGLHRKNMRPICPSNQGVDLNRNYAFEWGSDDGSSSNVCDDTYRGVSPFSEPESVAVRDFHDALNFTMSFNYHTYGQAIVYSRSAQPTVERTASALAAAGRLSWGTDADVLGYVTSGTADDYMMASAGGGNIAAGRELSFTPELGMCPASTSIAAMCFWPAPSFVRSMIEWGVGANTLLASLAGGHFGATAYYNESDVETSDDTQALPDDDVLVTVRVVNLGQSAPASALKVVVVAEDKFSFVENGTESEGVTREFLLPALAPGAHANVSFVCHVENDTATGDHLAFHALVLEGPFVRLRLPLRITVGEKLVVSIGAPESGIEDGWRTYGISETGWAVEKARVMDADDNVRYSFSLRPNEDTYQSEPLAVAVTGGTMDLRLAAHAYVRFEARWDIEPMWDMCALQASVDGKTWQSLKGRYTNHVTGMGAQTASLEQGWDGMQSSTVSERLSLDAFIGYKVALRFVMGSDGSLQRAGMFVDDIRLVLVLCDEDHCPSISVHGGRTTGEIVASAIGAWFVFSLALALVIVRRTYGQKVHPEPTVILCAESPDSYNGERLRAKCAEGLHAKLHVNVDAYPGNGKQPTPPPPYSADTIARSQWLAAGGSAGTASAAHSPLEFHGTGDLAPKNEAGLAGVQSVPRYYYCDDEGHPLRSPNGDVCLFWYGHDEGTGEHGQCFCYYVSPSDTAQISAAFAIFHGDVPGVADEREARGVADEREPRNAEDTGAVGESHPGLQISESLARALSAAKQRSGGNDASHV